MVAGASCRNTEWDGLPACELTLPQGDQVVVALHGAHVLSWVSAGRERLYLSPKSHMNGQAAIRGGIPVCFPQFNQRGTLPKHGFARNLPWTVSQADLDADSALLTLALTDSEATRRWWPQVFVARLRVMLAPNTLRVGLEVENTDRQPLAFTGALHTYLAVSDVAHARLLGLGGQAEWNAVTDQHGVAAQEIRFVGEFDRVYAAAQAPLTLEDGLHTLEIEQDLDWAHTVVWNPGAARCAALADMPPDGWPHMLCVEAAQVFDPIALMPGEQWAGSQCLRVV